MNGPGTVIFTGRSVWAAQELQVADLDRVRPVDRADDARHRVGVPGAVERGARVVDVDAVERGGEVVGVALAADLAVGEQVEPGALLGADRELVASSWAWASSAGSTRHSSFARTRGGKRPASFARSISHSGWA